MRPFRDHLTSPAAPYGLTGSVVSRIERPTRHGREAGHQNSIVGRQHHRAGRRQPQLRLRPPQGLKLLAACPEIRKACLAGEIGDEVALLIARLRAPKLQESGATVDLRQSSSNDQGGERRPCGDSRRPSQGPKLAARGNARASATRRPNANGRFQARRSQAGGPAADPVLTIRRGTSGRSQPG
jgi:hypothetical protein